MKYKNKEMTKEQIEQMKRVINQLKKFIKIMNEVNKRNE